MNPTAGSTAGSASAGERHELERREPSLHDACIITNASTTHRGRHCPAEARRRSTFQDRGGHTVKQARRHSAALQHSPATCGVTGTTATRYCCGLRPLPTRTPHQHRWAQPPRSRPPHSSLHTTASASATLGLLACAERPAVGQHRQRLILCANKQTRGPARSAGVATHSSCRERVEKLSVYTQAELLQQGWINSPVVNVPDERCCIGRLRELRCQLPQPAKGPLTRCRGAPSTNPRRSLIAAPDIT